MQNNKIVNVIVILIFLVLPILLEIPKFKFSQENIVSLGAGLVGFYLITGLTAHESYRKKIFLLPLILLILIGISYVPISLSPEKLLAYYVLVIGSLAISLASNLFATKENKRSRSRSRRRRKTVTADDEENE